MKLMWIAYVSKNTMTIKSTRIKGLKLKAEIDGFEIIAGRIDDNTPPEGPSPSKLMIASLGLCVGLYAAHYLKRHNISDDGLTVDVDTEEANDPSRVVRFDVKVNLKAELTEQEKAGLLASVSRCYVGNTLKMSPEIRYSLNLTMP
jgi:ribosomal protein S12 methylthiotransferase accessory factor